MSAKLSTVDLGELAKQINRAHASVIGSAKRTVLDALRCGELLIEAKRKVRHGQWSDWLAENCPDISLRSAERYSFLAANREDIEAKIATLADLTLAEAERCVPRRVTTVEKPEPHLVSGPPVEKSVEPALIVGLSTTSRQTYDLSSASNPAPEPEPEAGGNVVKLPTRAPDAPSVDLAAEMDRCRLLTLLRRQLVALREAQPNFESDAEKLSSVERTNAGIIVSDLMDVLSKVAALLAQRRLH